MEEITPTNNLTDRVYKLESAMAVQAVNTDTILQQLREIKNNHLVHINDKLEVLSKSVNDNQIATVEKINSLQLTDAGAAPTQAIVADVIKYIIIAIVAAVLTLLISHSLA